MSWLGDLVSPVTDFFSGIPSSLSSLASGALGYAGTQSTNDQNAAIAQANNAWSAQQYATRYQTMTKDMQSAGLSPMLAYSQSAGSAPTAQQVQFQNPMSSATQAYHESSQRDVMSAQIKNIESDTAKNEAIAALNKAQANEAEERALLTNAQKAQTALGIHHTTQTDKPTQKALGAMYWSQVAVNKETLPKIAQEIKTGGAYAKQAYANAYKAFQDGKVSSQEFEVVRQAAEYAKKTGMLDPALRSIGTAAGAYRSIRGSGTTVNKTYNSIYP